MIILEDQSMITREKEKNEQKIFCPSVDSIFIKEWSSSGRGILTALPNQLSYQMKPRDFTSINRQAMSILLRKLRDRMFTQAVTIMFLSL